MKTLIASFLAFGMIVSTGLLSIGSAHAAQNGQFNDRTTWSSDQAG